MLGCGCINISEQNLLPIYLNPVYERVRVISSGLPASSFSNIIVNHSISAQEDISDAICDYDKTKECMCDSDYETSEATETKKTGFFEACIDCACRKAGECAFWNGKEDILDMILGMSNDSSNDGGIQLSYNQLDFQPNVITNVETWLNYSTALTYMTKKQLGILK